MEYNYTDIVTYIEKNPMEEVACKHCGREYWRMDWRKNSWQNIVVIVMKIQ